MANHRKYVPSTDPVEDRKRIARTILTGARGKLAATEEEEVRSIIDGNQPSVRHGKGETSDGPTATQDRIFVRLQTEFAHLLK